MKRSDILRRMNMFLAGAITALGFASCDKDDDSARNDDEVICMYGPSPVSYTVVVPEDINVNDDESNIVVEVDEVTENF